ncbi:MAG: sensor domain-containing diguanylate cyclase, partial [Thiolinea sp.]
PLNFFSSRLIYTLMLLPVMLITLIGCAGKEVAGANDQYSGLYWLEDTSGAMTFDDISSRNLSTQWQQADNNNPNFGFTNSAYWFSLPIENPKSELNPMLLEIAFPLHDSIDVYLLDGNAIVKTFHTGDKLPFVQRPLHHRNFLFPHIVAPEKKLRAILRIQSTDTMYVPVKVWENSEFVAANQQQTLFLGLFFGFLSIMLVYNLLLYFSTGHKNYRNYVWCTAAILYLQLAQTNLGYQYIWPGQSFFNHLSIPVSTFIVIGTSSFFILGFLGLNKKQYPKIVLTFRTFIWTAIAGTIWTTTTMVSGLTIIPYTAMLLTTAVTGAIATITVLTILITLCLKGDRSARILSVAWLSLLIGSLLFALGRIGIPIPMLISENAMLIGSTFEAALISFALARHIKKEREARLQAQELALINERKTREAQNSLLILQQQTTQQLEQEVRERTHKLEMTMKSLTQANRKLNNLARMDALTGLSNRRDFDQELQHEWQNNLRQRQPISLLMADIDHFKMINDTYGHLFGDQCLVNVASIMKSCANRVSDLVARFGGEEFIILLPDTDSKEASLIAEHIRRSIQQLCISYQGQQIHFTISIGVATVIPTPGTSSTDLIASADQSLYLAKEGGRNQVITLGNYIKNTTGSKNSPPPKQANAPVEPVPSDHLATRQADITQTTAAI